MRESERKKKKKEENEIYQLLFKYSINLVPCENLYVGMAEMAEMAEMETVIFVWIPRSAFMLCSLCTI